VTHFADSSFFVALLNKRDHHHKKAQEIFSDVLNGKYGKLVTSDYILDEGMTVTRQKTKDYEAAMKAGRMIKDSAYTKMTYIIKVYVEDAYKSYKEHTDKTLSFTDWTSYHVIKFKGLSGIISFDEDFDEVDIPRIPGKTG